MTSKPSLPDRAAPAKVQGADWAATPSGNAPVRRRVGGSGAHEDEVVTQRPEAPIEEPVIADRFEPVPSTRRALKLRRG
jgi:hypothetical protein